MLIIAIIITLLIISFFMALHSMKDFETPKEIARLLTLRKVRGTIVFMKDKIAHYSSSSSST
ncbi:hypothetical protein KAZ66_01905 [Candidatus Woesebacteria bacterium]|nr:hypothetical protein [Candidatus Woesebacteria bacterium]